MAEKIRIKGQLKLPVVGKSPTFAQMKFVKVALSEQDILPESGSIFTCDDQGNYDFEIYTGKHLLSYNVGNSWSKPIEIIAETLADGLDSIEISDLIGFQEIPELDATIAALNQQKQELLAIQQDVISKQAQITSASTNINDTIDDAKAGYPDIVRSMFSSTIYVDNVNGDDSNSGSTLALAKRTIKSAIESAPNSSSVTVHIADQKHLIDSDVTIGSRLVTIAAISGAPEIAQMQNQTSSDYASYGFKITAGGFVYISGCKITTAVMTTSKVGTFESYKNALFVPISGYPVSVKLYNAVIFIGNSPLGHIHGEGSLDGAIDLYIMSSTIELATTTIDTGSMVLVGFYRSSKFPQTIMINAVTNNTGIAWSDLIPANSMLQTNIVMTINHNNAEYINFDAESAVNADIVAVFDAALADQQAQDFFESEKSKAILIMNDHMLGTGEEEITDLQLMDVKAYIQSIDPAKGFKVGIARAKVPRPPIFSRYD